MCSCCSATYYGQTQRHFLERASEHLGMTSLISKFVKRSKKPAIFDHVFKLQLKESLLISRNKLILNKNICSVFLELFD